MAGERSPTPTKIGETSDHVMDFIGLQAQFSQIIKTSQKIDAPLLGLTKSIYCMMLLSHLCQVITGSIRNFPVRAFFLCGERPGGTHGGLMSVSALDSGSSFIRLCRSGVRALAGTIHCVLGLDALFSLSLSPSRSSTVYR